MSGSGIAGLTGFRRMGRVGSVTIPRVKTTDIPFGRQMMTKLRRFLRNVPVPRFGAAAVTAGVRCIPSTFVRIGSPW
jgi:hypothetical protein